MLSVENPRESDKGTLISKMETTQRLAAGGFYKPTKVARHVNSVVLFTLLAVDVTGPNGAKLSFCFDNFADADFSHSALSGVTQAPPGDGTNPLSAGQHCFQRVVIRQWRAYGVYG